MFYRSTVEEPDQRQRIQYTVVPTYSRYSAVGMRGLVRWFWIESQEVADPSFSFPSRRATATATATLNAPGGLGYFEL